MDKELGVTEDKIRKLTLLSDGALGGLLGYIDNVLACGFYERSLEHLILPFHIVCVKGSLL